MVLPWYQFSLQASRLLLYDNMTNIRLDIEFDGTEFAGWQIQPNQRTVQEEIEKGLFKLTSETIRITGAGRTDSGVHALGMVANFKSDKTLPVKAYENGLNTLIPNDIYIKSARFVEDTFDARRCAIRRSYCYRIAKSPRAVGRQYAWYPRGPFELGKMKEASEYLVGEHDFDAFSKYSEDIKTYKSIVYQVQWKATIDEIWFEISAVRFFHHMIRIITGTLFEVGQGRMSVFDFKKVLDSKDRSLAGPTIPPHGLFLTKVEYENELFKKHG